MDVEETGNSLIKRRNGNKLNVANGNNVKNGKRNKVAESYEESWPEE